MQIFITGANGFIGGAVASALIADGHTVRGLVRSKAKADAFLKNPASIKGQTIVLTANSTGDYAVQSCLAKWGLKKADVSIKSMGQAEIISASIE